MSDGRYVGPRSRESIPRRPAGKATCGLADDLARLATVVAALRRAADAHVERADRELIAARATASRTADRERAALDARLADGADAMRQVALARAERLAPGLAAADWDFPGWTSPEWLGTGPTRCVRIGQVIVDGAGAIEPVPAVLPLLVTSGWALSGPDAADLLRALLLRLVATVPAHQLRISVHDPRIDGLFAAFSAVRRSAAGCWEEPTGSAEALRGGVAEHTRAVARVADVLGAAGHDDLLAYQAATGRPAGQYRVQVLLRYPDGVDEDTQAELLRLAEAGPHRGVSLLVQHDPAIAAARGVRPDDLLSRLVRVGPASDGLAASVLDSVVIRPDPPPPRGLVVAVAEAVAESAERTAAPTVCFSELLPHPAHRWVCSAADGLATVIGLDGDEAVEIALRGSNPPQPNLLLGGAVGQGKSNALLVLIHGLAARYSPDDLAMYLLDFKEGLEFDRLGPTAQRGSWLPHVRVLGLESDREFGLAVLDHLVAEFHRRAEAFKAAGVADLGDYRCRVATPMPRLLLVIDEFQVLLDGDDDNAHLAAAALETLARKGRAYGIHLVLASQTLSGLQALARNQDAIFSQFPLRIALRTTAAESQVLLAPQNSEAARLRFRGEAVVNADFGAIEGNRRVVIARAEEKHLGRLRDELWSAAPTVTPPQLFRTSRPASLAGSWGRSHDRPAEAWLGLPVAVDPDPCTVRLDAQLGRSLTVLGDGPDAALGVLGAAVASLAAGHAPGATEFVLANLVPDDAWSPLMERVVRGHGHDVRTVARRELAGELVELARLAQERFDAGASAPPIYLVAAGLHLAPGLTVADPDTFLLPMDALRALVGTGAASGVHVLGWWSSVRAAEEQLGFDLAGAQCQLFLRVPQADAQKVCGALVRWEPRPHRALLRDATVGQPVPVVPFAPITEADLPLLIPRRPR